MNKLSTAELITNESKKTTLNLEQKLGARNQNILMSGRQNKPTVF